jgi:hypothetical protein
MELVNGYVCKNCTDVGYAKRFIDPAHPKDGPSGRDAPDKAAKTADAERGPAVTFGGALAQVQAQAQAQAPNGVEAVRPSQAASPTSIDLQV